MVFLSQKVDGKMIFTWYFWAFHDIPGPGKYRFSRSATRRRGKALIFKSKALSFYTIDFSYINIFP